MQVLNVCLRLPNRTLRAGLILLLVLLLLLTSFAYYSQAWHRTIMDSKRLSGIVDWYLKLPRRIHATAMELKTSIKANRNGASPHPMLPDQLRARERVQNHRTFQPFFTAAERSVVLNLLETVSQVFRMHNITFVMYGGTLLGSHRHHGLVPWDDDIDLLLSLAVRDRLPGILAEAAPRLTLQRAGGHDKIFDVGHSKRTGPYPWHWPYLDISFYAENSTHLWDFVYASAQYVYPKYVVLPVHDRPFEHLWLPSPRDSLAFLQLTYGRSGNCVATGYSHMTEGGAHSGQRPCIKFKRTVPFVHRQPCESAWQLRNNCVLETLKLGRRPLRSTVVVDEPSFAINEPFSLRLLKGFTQPSYYPKMSDRDL